MHEHLAVSAPCYEYRPHFIVSFLTANVASNIVIVVASSPFFFGPVHALIATVLPFSRRVIPTPIAFLAFVTNIAIVDG